MTITFDIERWDAVLLPGLDNPRPAIYIKPNPEFIIAAGKQYNEILTTVRGSESQYDNVEVLSVLDTSGVIPNHRPNFFAQTGYYVIVLGGWWLGYPKKMGRVDISLSNGGKKEDAVREKIQEKIKKPENKVVTENFNRINIIYIAVILLVILLICIKK